MVSSSCDDVGRIQITIESSSSDPCEFGFYVYANENDLPAGLIPGYPVRPFKQNGQCVIHLNWIDGASETQEALDFDLQFEALNHHLLKGDRSEKLKVIHDGRSKPPSS